MNKPQIVRHGEVILKPITELPKEVSLQSQEKSVIVAHSETGHHHVLKTKSKQNIRVYSWNGETYLEVPELSELFHEKTGKDVHMPHKITPSAYKVVIKKEFDYFQKATRQVRD